MAGLTNAQTLYTLPVSLFGMSVSAAERLAMATVAITDTAVSRTRAAASIRACDGLPSS